jgi:hypothetical protein
VKDVPRAVGAEANARHLEDGNVVEPRRATNVLREQRPLAEAVRRVELRLEQSELDDERRRLGRVGGNLQRQLLPPLVLAPRAEHVRLRHGGRDYPAVEVDEVSRDPAPRVRELRGLNVPLDAVMRPLLHLDPPRVVPVDQRPAVEVKPKAVLPRPSAVRRQSPVHVMRQPRPVHLRPVHRELFGVPQSPLLEIERPQHPVHLRRLRAANPGGNEHGENGKEAGHGPINSLSANCPADLK